MDENRLDNELKEGHQIDEFPIDGRCLLMKKLRGVALMCSVQSLAFFTLYPLLSQHL